MTGAESRHRTTVTAFFALLAVLAGRPPATAQTELRPLPELRLENADSGLRERLFEARATIDWLQGQEGTGAAELAEAFGELGRLYLSSGLNVAAAAAFSNAAALAPQEFRWAYYLGAVQHRERRLAESESALRRALELRPDDLPTLLRLADVAFLEARRQESRQLYERALALAAPSPGAEASRAFAHYGLGKLDVDAGAWRQAASHFEAALEAAPEASAVRRLLGLAYRELGDVERARSELRASGVATVSFADPLMENLADLDTGALLWPALHARRRGDLEQAAALYRQAVDSEPEVASYHRSLSNVLALQGDLDGAIAELERALELEADHVLSNQQLGELLGRRDGWSEKSFAYLRRAVELAPKAPEPKLALARALAIAQRHEEALDLYDDLVAETPRDPLVRRLRGRSLQRLGRDAEAIGDFEAALAVDSDDPRAMLELATVLSRSGETSRALDLFRSALALDLGERDRALALFSVAGLTQQQGDDESAIPLYRQVLELVPEMKDAHFNLAAALARTGRAAAAAEHFGRAVRLDPGDAAARLAWVRALIAIDAHGAARDALDDAVGEDDADPRLVNLLAQLLAGSPDPATRDPERAVELAARALRRDPTVRHAATLAQALAAAHRPAEAVEVQKKVVADAERLGVPPAQLEQLRQALAYYQGLAESP